MTAPSAHEPAGDLAAPRAQSPDAVLDARDLKCPLPVLRARKMLKTLAPGQVLRVDASDPDSVEDFRSFCAAGAAELIAQDEAGEGPGLFRHWLRARPEP